MAADHTQNFEFYRELVHELLRDKADEKKVKGLMRKLGIPYSAHSVDRLSRVLAYNPQSDRGLNYDLR